ncbi:RecE family exodeoxyribonuclease [Klebsiella pneumoniae]|uniref:RecE family exodeoxyribonuclease n=1 Tax=Klebsiella pneumoniae TaxID=573 RepID=UPI000C7C16A7|nr:RecE family exodeoxyribonuclease [Klebsiella pneumoniae]PLD73697.1 hypothetical protein B6I60_10025 [Klebsiella pneumoniae]
MTVELKTFCGALFQKDKALKKQHLDALAIAVNAPNKSAATKIIAGKMLELLPQHDDDYFAAKIWEDAENLPTPPLGQFCSEYFKVDATWNTDTGLPSHLLLTSHDEDSSDDGDDALLSLAEMPFRIQLLAQYLEEDHHAYHISPERRKELSTLEMDTDNSGVQDLILAAESVPEIKSYDMPALWKFASSYKKVFPAGKRHELSIQVQFAKLWFKTAHTDRGILVREWAAGNRITEVALTPAGAKAGGGNVTDRLNPLTALSLEYEICLGIIARNQDFDIYNIPLEIDVQANGMMNRMDDPEFIATRELFLAMPGGLDYSRACNVATVKTTPEGLWQDPVKHLEYLNRVMTETDHAHPDQLVIDIACGRTSMPMPQPGVAQIVATTTPIETVLQNGPEQRHQREIEIDQQIRSALNGASTVLSQAEAADLIKNTGVDEARFIDRVSFDLFFIEQEREITVTDDEIHHLTCDALENWLDVPAARVKMLCEKLEAYRECVASETNTEEAPITQPEAVKLDPPAVSVKPQAESQKEPCEEIPLGDFEQRLVASALQGLCANPAWCTSYDEIPSMARWLARAAVSGGH